MRWVSDEGMRWSMVGWVGDEGVGWGGVCHRGGVGWVMKGWGRVGCVM